MFKYLLSLNKFDINQQNEVCPAWLPRSSVVFSAICCAVRSDVYASNRKLTGRVCVSICREQYSMSPGRVAANNGNVEVVKLLHEAKANLKEASEDGSILHGGCNLLASCAKTCFGRRCRGLALLGTDSVA